MEIISVFVLLGILGIGFFALKQLQQKGAVASLERLERLSREEAGQLRQEMTQTLLNFNESICQMVQGRLDKLNTDNAQKLEQMRAVVDEKLHETLEKRFNESFSLVSERLEKVHQGLGEMQNLAADVGGLKRVLSNVKARGTWGEVQLESLLSQMLDTHQYQKNVHIKESQEVVEFAILLPDNVWIPLDSKFPLEDYERLTQAQEHGDIEGVEHFGGDLEKRVKQEAKRIKDKYIYPPKTTDFGILFLPTEGLYAEVIRRPGLVSEVQNKLRVSICGPSTLCAFLNSLQMGFKTLAIQKHSSEVWAVLREAKEEFIRYGDWVEKVRRQLETASKTLDEAERRTKAVHRRLKSVESKPETEVEGVNMSPPLLEQEEG